MSSDLGMNTARATEKRQSAEIRELFELSDLLVADKDIDELLSVIVTTLADVFGSRKVALLPPHNHPLAIVRASRPLGRGGYPTSARAADDLRQPDRTRGRTRAAARRSPAGEADRGGRAAREDSRRRGLPRPSSSTCLDQGIVVDAVRRGDRHLPRSPPEPQ